MSILSVVQTWKLSFPFPRLKKNHESHKEKKERQKMIFQMISILRAMIASQ